MRNIIIMAFALFLGAAAANAHGHSRGHGLGCARAKIFLKYNGAGIDALLEKEATGHMKTFQDVAKIKVDLLQKAIALDPPIPFLCHKALKKVKKLVKMVAVAQAMMAARESSGDASPADADTTAKEPAKPDAEPTVKDLAKADAEQDATAPKVVKE